MTPRQLASQLWVLLSNAKASGDHLSRVDVLTALSCTEAELEEATAILKEMIESAEQRMQAPRPVNSWIPFAKRKPSKEVRRLIAYG